ncbi:MAG TPA: twin-arginine translocase TatA/TatE family subunit [Clostridia bacterium]|jgi:sec-independent protein translocase protein TatA|nr:twin-arginine translocase TatA/TatE family subunit [Clostridia bacterium]HPY44023.1 twin-arginine translocase TatA/TatE family subunit [Clostridia bacterium]HQA97831.1 twin-arginine translocase TatA/TatE family subunit [Clostridia bacterium]HQO56292.1 twin-arginine translocase TatA/TatE family subunit [Clostridia bacterium]
MRLGALEIVLILVLALVLFGGKKLSGVGKALGQSIKEFRREMAADDQEKASEPPADQENKG